MKNKSQKLLKMKGILFILLFVQCAVIAQDIKFKRRQSKLNSVDICNKAIVVDNVHWISISDNHLSVYINGKMIMDAKIKHDKIAFYINGELTSREIWEHQYFRIKTKYFSKLQRA